MTMLPVELPTTGRLELRAVDPARNIDRRYSIERSVDLFGVHLVETSWGRTGTWAQSICRSYDTQADADREVRAHLRRRSRAPARIGIAYKVIEVL